MSKMENVMEIFLNEPPEEVILSTGEDASILLYFHQGTGMTQQISNIDLEESASIDDELMEIDEIEEDELDSYEVPGEGSFDDIDLERGDDLLFDNMDFE